MTKDLIHGIDFSGNVKMWEPHCGRSNVWIATAKLGTERPQLLKLGSAQELPGEGHPFDRLAKLLADANYLAAAIDAPFSLPARHMPKGGFPALLKAVNAFEKGDRPFAKGKMLVDYAERIKAKEKKKPMRATEALWKRQGVNVRSTLWNGPRGGAPFTTACLTLLAKAGRPVWPWDKNGPGLLVEAFPAGQLRCWGLPDSGYANGASTRRKILQGIGNRIVLPATLRSKCLNNADALDAALCLFSAIAAVSGVAPSENTKSTETEGWIAVHPV